MSTFYFMLYNFVFKTNTLSLQLKNYSNKTHIFLLPSPIPPQSPRLPIYINNHALHDSFLKLQYQCEVGPLSHYYKINPKLFCNFFSMKISTPRPKSKNGKKLTYCEFISWLFSISSSIHTLILSLGALSLCRQNLFNILSRLYIPPVGKKFQIYASQKTNKLKTKTKKLLLMPHQVSYHLLPSRQDGGQNLKESKKNNVL